MHYGIGSLVANFNHWGLISLNFPFVPLDFRSWDNNSLVNHQQFFCDVDMDFDRFEMSHLPEFIRRQKIQFIFIESDSVFPRFLNDFKFE